MLFYCNKIEYMYSAKWLISQRYNCKRDYVVSSISCTLLYRDNRRSIEFPEILQLKEIRKLRQVNEICRGHGRCPRRCRNFNRGSGFGRDIAIRHESNVSNGCTTRSAIFDVVSRGIKDATVNLNGSSFRWRNTIVRRCRWPEVCSKGYPGARPFYCDAIYDCTERLLSFLRPAGTNLWNSLTLSLYEQSMNLSSRNLHFSLLPVRKKKDNVITWK